MEGKISIPKLYEVLSRILSDKYDMDITITARRKEEVQEEKKDSQVESA